jgi:glycosyltransferase involved in cell wall biosynthesis
VAERYHVSAIIPCRNEERHIEDVIKILLQADLTDIDLEILVVDGMSTDGTRAILEKLQSTHHNLKLIDNPELITPVAFNLGIHHSNGDYIFIIGARHLISSNYIVRCLESLSEDSTIAGVGGRVINLSTNSKSTGIALAMSSPLGVGMGNYRVTDTEVFVDTIGTPIYRKAIFEEVGVFDEVLVRNQDDELNHRITSKGYKLKLLPDITISYYVRDDFNKLFMQYFQYGYWKIYVNKKHKTITTFRQIIPAAFIACIFFGAILSVFPPFKYIYFFFVGLYLVLLAATSINKGIKTGIFTFLSFLCLHFGYGLGYLKGIIDFILLNKKPSGKMKNLTR